VVRFIVPMYGRDQAPSQEAEDAGIRMKIALPARKAFDVRRSSANISSHSQHPKPD
jgi:hypothetical protein